MGRSATDPLHGGLRQGTVEISNGFIMVSGYSFVQVGQRLASSKFLQFPAFPLLLFADQPEHYQRFRDADAASDRHGTC